LLQHRRPLWPRDGQLKSAIDERRHHDRAGHKF
jgi:hypothetical protein